MFLNDLIPAEERLLRDYDYALKKFPIDNPQWVEAHERPNN
jgi:hypothetical protein